MLCLKYVVIISSITRHHITITYDIYNDHDTNRMHVSVYICIVYMMDVTVKYVLCLDIDLPTTLSVRP
jgi:hypothetical protein